MAIDLPRYQSYKKVHALMIAKISVNSFDVTIKPVLPYASFKVSLDYFNKHDPQVGGYWVLYEDGYESFSPADAFESGYTRI